jgi:Pyruvate/2-oxoacid:ferredoxin oxidoreductase delta subunit
MIKVDPALCIGCLACSNVCPSKNIIRDDTIEKRTISWKKCGEECDLCVEFCPARALTLVPESEETAIAFELVACRICGARYATEAMLRRIEASLPEALQKDSSGLAWIWVCPVCRRNLEAERATREMVLGRSRSVRGDRDR